MQVPKVAGSQAWKICNIFNGTENPYCRYLDPLGLFASWRGDGLGHLRRGVFGIRARGFKAQEILQGLLGFSGFGVRL